MPFKPHYEPRLCSGDFGLSPREAAEDLGLSIHQLTPLTEMRWVPHARTFGGHRRFSPADIECIRAMLASGEVTVGARKAKRSPLARARAQEARERFLRRANPDRGKTIITVDIGRECLLALDALQAAYGGNASDIMRKLITVAAATVRAPDKNHLTTRNK